MTMPKLFMTSLKFSVEVPIAIVDALTSLNGLNLLALIIRCILLNNLVAWLHIFEQDVIFSGIRYHSGESIDCSYPSY
jgi:hypothetical protein